MTQRPEAKPNRPLPLVDNDSAPFWEALKKHQLVLQRCSHCKKYVHPPTPMCPHCNSLEPEWPPSNGTGRVYSWIIVRRAAHPFFSEVPYNVVLVEMDEGVRLFGNLADMEPDQIREGMPVQLELQDVGEGFTLYQFRAVERLR